MTMFLSQIILLVVSIKQRFTALNFLLKLRKKLDVHELKIASKIHQSLAEVIEAMNESYCKILLFIFAGVFGFFNLLLFSLRIILAFYNFGCFIIFMGKVLINIYSFTSTMFVIFVSSKATNEAKKTLRKLYKLSNRIEGDAEWNQQFLIFVKQIKCSELKLSCGFFSFNWQLFYKVN
jgi:7tm Chemosensory receptor